jgi:hypothetical protein
MSPKQRLHLDKNQTRQIGQFVSQDLMQKVLDLATLELAHQLAKSDLDPAAMHWKLSGAHDFARILLDLGVIPEIPQRQPPAQLNHNA